MSQLREEVDMPPTKDVNVRRPSRFLWTPTGLVDLAEPSDLREFKPTLLGTFEPLDREGPSADVVPDCARGALENLRGFDDVHKNFPISGDSSHDSDLMLG